MDNGNKFVKSFSGKGFLKIDNTMGVEVDFDILQLIDSDIVAYCKASSFKFEPTRFHERVTLEGNEENGLLVVMPNALMKEYSSEGNSQCIVLNGTCLNIGEQSLMIPASAHFNITNFEFRGISSKLEEQKNGLNTRTRSLSSLPFVIDEEQASLQQLFYYEENLQLAKATRGVAATAELSFKINSKDDINKVRSFADNICLLLSLARGCKINSINCEIRNASGNIFNFIGYSIPKKGFGDQYVQELKPQWPKGTMRFLEHCYSHICAANDNWEFKKAVDFYLDAKREGDEFEFWGLKMVVCMEFLRAKFLAQFREQPIVPQKVFNKIKQSLKDHLRSGLCNSIYEITEEQITLIEQKLGELNRLGFGDSLIRMNKHVEARISNDSVAKFVKIRNSLVHHGTYCTDVNKYGQPAEQYRFLDEYVRRFLFGIVGNPLETVWSDNTYSDGTLVSENYARKF